MDAEWLHNISGIVDGAKAWNQSIIAQPISLKINKVRSSHKKITRLYLLKWQYKYNTIKIVA